MTSKKFSRAALGVVVLAGLLGTAIGGPAGDAPAQAMTNAAPEVPSDPKLPAESGEPNDGLDPNLPAPGDEDLTGPETDVEVDGEAADPELSEPLPDDEVGTADVPTADAPQLLRAAPLAATPFTETRNTRLSGANRYATAAAVSRHAYPKTADTVILVNGMDFPDSLAAGALSARLGAPMLLTDHAHLPQETLAELKRLRPKEVIVVGGDGVVSAAVFNQARNLAGSAVRLGGTDRYTTAVAVSKHGWRTSKDVFVATGTDFADALAAAAAAGKLRVPVLLVPGNAASAPASVIAELKRLGATSMRIAGGTGAVSTAMQRSLAGSGSVTRYAGIDRYDTAAKIARGVYAPGVSSTYWANGLGFADALAGAAAAGARGSVLLLTRADCVPTISYAANDAVAPADTYLLGGPGVLADTVRNGNECMTKPSGVSAADWELVERMYAKINASRYSEKLGALRVADSYRGAPAQSWAGQLGTGPAKQQPGLWAKQPWVRYQTTAVVSGSGNRADRALALMQTTGAGTRWLTLPNGGARGYVSIGMKTTGGKTAAVVFLGAGLNK
ncbi:cell wall-binding repeat-containing protein [Leucobacter aridicollis]|uniref:cell wall-binding repeat-containing protein n=1 Tax=Leucobacter aridicollis TaxID=283878 RepID=UPI000E65D88D|nr:cell wall-binding repeat-containing protein [Leucobacter aridicollis]UTX52783.1 cell wall-binding repeat-containing protein [Leucobacter aridicollis]